MKKARAGTRTNDLTPKIVHKNHIIEARNKK